MKNLDIVKDSVWVEKYRPKKLEELVLPEDYRKIFERAIFKNELNNFLFYGAPGGGKSATARILCSPNGVMNFPDYNVLLINGSSKSSRGISFVDDVIEPFLKVPPIKDKYKIVFIEEFDNITPDAFKSLRALMEKFLESYGRFVCTCNYVSKIPDPIISRFDSYHFKQLPKEYVLKFCKDILTKENIEYKEDDINFIINSFYPDIRKIVNRLERCSGDDKKLIVDKNKVLSIEQKILSVCLEMIDAISNNEESRANKLRDSIIDQLTNPEISYADLYTQLHFNKKVPIDAKIVINEFANKHQGCIEPSMNFASMIYKVIFTCKAYFAVKPN